MARPSTNDPLDKFRWIVVIDNPRSEDVNSSFTKAGFHTCSTPEYNITTKSYAEGGSHLTPRKIIDTVSYKPITLTRGVTNDTSFNKWATACFDLVQNNSVLNETSSDFPMLTAALDKGAQAVQSNNGTLSTFTYRRDLKLFHLDRLGQTQVVYELYSAFPIDYKPASDFDANADDGVSIESITLDYESFTVKYTGIAGFLGDLASKLLIK